MMWVQERLILFQLCEVLVRLEYCVQVWSLYLRKDRGIMAMACLRVDYLDWSPSFEYKRMTGQWDLTVTSKPLMGLEYLDMEPHWGAHNHETLLKNSTQVNDHNEWSSRHEGLNGLLLFPLVFLCSDAKTCLYLAQYHKVFSSIKVFWRIAVVLGKNATIVHIKQLQETRILWSLHSFKDIGRRITIPIVGALTASWKIRQILS